MTTAASNMAANVDLNSILTTLCSTSKNRDNRDYRKLLDVIEQLRQVLLNTNDGPAVPVVLNNEVVFKSVFCFLLDARGAFRFLEELGGRAVLGWSTMAEMEPLEFVQKIRSRSASEKERTAAVVVLFLCSALRLSATVIETLELAREERVQRRGSGDEIGSPEDRISDVQKGLNKDLISCVHLGKLMESRDPEEETICGEQSRQMFAAFSIVTQLLYEHGDITTLKEMMSLSEAAFQLAYEESKTVIDLKVDVSERFLSGMIKTLVSGDPELSYRVPFRMYWYYMYVQMEKRASCDQEWRVDQQLSNANHYCADNAMTYHGGRYAFTCWLLYGLSLFECEEHATAEAVLKMDHLAMVKTMLPTSKVAADCVHKSRGKATQKEQARKEHLLYFGNARTADPAPETTVWHSIYDDPAVRRYSPRHIPDYAQICRRLKESDGLPKDTAQSLVLESVGPLIDLAYQPKKPTKVVRSDNSVNIYGGSVNENLDVQSHLVDVTASKEELPDIDMMMAVNPSLTGLDCKLDSSAASQRYAYMVNSTTGERLPSFELLVDSLPIALNKVAEFVADVAFALEYEILSIAIHGPAITTKLRRGGETILSYDHVPAFWIKTWPDVAKEWVTRRRRFGWPSAAVIKDIVQDGVLLVAACHHNSTDPNNEWRLSFTIAERMLVDTLSGVQRLAYLYAKLVWMFSLKSSSFLVSYHLKNALLWLCEERPGEFWTGDNLVGCVRDIFSWLRREISDGHLRSYFIPTDNMIPSSVTVKSTGDLVQALDHITDNLFQYIVDADAGLRHISLLNDLRIGELAETVECRPLASDDSLVGHLRRLVADIGESSLDGRQALLDALDTALRLDQRS